MNADVTLRIEARVDKREQAGLVAAGEQLTESLAQACGGEQRYHIDIRVAPPGTGLGDRERPAAVIASLLPDALGPDEPIDVTAQRWQLHIESLQAGGAPVYVRNVFRHVEGRHDDGRPTALVDRIRRLNRLAIELSRQTGAAIIDVDRAFAHLGARELRCDYRLQGAMAAQLSGHATVLALLSYGLDDTLDAQLQEKARALQGSLLAVRPFLQRRLARAGTVPSTAAHRQP